MLMGWSVLLIRGRAARRATAIFLSATFLLGTAPELAAQIACSVFDASHPASATEQEHDAHAAHHDTDVENGSPLPAPQGEQAPQCVCETPHPTSRTTPFATSVPATAVTLPEFEETLTPSVHEAHLGRLPFRILPFANGPPGHA